MMTNKLEFYVDLWHNFYKSELLKNVTISDADNVHFGSYAESFYTISGTIDIAPRAVSAEALIEELNARDVKSLRFKVTLSTRISRDSYDYVARGGSNELDGFIDTLVIDKYVTVDGEEHSGTELNEDSVFYREVLLHFIDSLYKPVGVVANSLRIIVKRRRN